MKNLKEQLKALYDQGQDDYWVPAFVGSGESGPMGRIQPNDTVVFCCRRGEREVQLTESFVEEEFDRFPRKHLLDLRFVPMAQYHEKFAYLEPAFPPVRPHNVLRDVLSKYHKKQLAVSESEKEAHVTYFLNGRNGQLFPEQDAKIVPSVKNFKEHPEMKSREVGDVVAEALSRYDFIAANIPAGDVIGHLDDWDVKVKSIEVVDEVLGRVVGRALEEGFTTIITADHGLIEKGRSQDGSPSVSHTTAKVPFILVSEGLHRGDVTMNAGSLADVAPTILSILGLPIPDEMTGIPLVKAELACTKVFLLILDGWGVGEPNAATNPIYAANTPFFDALKQKYPNTLLEASGVHVGLPEGRSGNSETGHLTIGAGRVVQQDELRLLEAMKTGFRNNDVIVNALQQTHERGRALHLIGILSEASSHGTIKEVVEIASLAKEMGVGDTYVHVVLDGRSAPRQGAVDLLDRYEPLLADAKIVTAVGRGYALDRGRDYVNKTRLVYEALVEGKGIPFGI